MDRRSFITASSALGGMALGGMAMAQARDTGDRQYYELRQYSVASEEQAARLVQFCGDALIPALNRAGVAQVGVFLPDEGLGPVRMLLCHPTPASVAGVTQALLADETFLADGAAFLDLPASDPGYTRLESSMFLAFESMPTLETPVTEPGRHFQLRIYESPTIRTGQKKIEMFNTKEIEIFRKTGLHPVFFGEALVGASMPNLTYMLGFESAQEREEAWARFIADPEWKELSGRPEYADDKILCGITNILLTPAECSQV